MNEKEEVLNVKAKNDDDFIKAIKEKYKNPNQHSKPNTGQPSHAISHSSHSNSINLPLNQLNYTQRLDPPNLRNKSKIALKYESSLQDKLNLCRQYESLSQTVIQDRLGIKQRALNKDIVANSIHNGEDYGWTNDQKNKRGEDRQLKIMRQRYGEQYGIENTSPIKNFLVPVTFKSQRDSPVKRKGQISLIHQQRLSLIQKEKQKNSSTINKVEDILKTIKRTLANRQS